MVTVIEMGEHLCVMCEVVASESCASCGASICDDCAIWEDSEIFCTEECHES